MAKTPSIPKGTRDFNPQEVAKRNYIRNTITSSFQHFGFQPIETPSFENYDTLMGKYGDEGDRLIFKILNSGDYLSKVDSALYESKNSSFLTSKIADKALRYDLTVPFARYVVQHRNDISFPFKRYQVQPVWRADRPQKGRFREFYQCDADVVGSKSLLQEVEFIQLYDDVFDKLGLKHVTVNINNRKILSGIAQVIGAQEKLIDFTVALDKLDKIGEEKVKQEMLNKGIDQKGIDKLQPLFELQGSFDAQIDNLKIMLASSEEGLEGIKELSFIYSVINSIGLKSISLRLNLTLARGLNYYTGAIFEVSPPPSVTIGSIGGGGRYDDLTGIFGLKNVSGVGISFGLDRIYLVLEELNLFPKTVSNNTDVLFINFGDKEALFALKTINMLRQKGFNVELYPDKVKMKKQMTYANKRNIPFVVLIGDEEMKTETFAIKKMISGEQTKCNFSEMIDLIKK